MPPRERIPAWSAIPCTPTRRFSNPKVSSVDDGVHDERRDVSPRIPHLPCRTRWTFGGGYTPRRNTISNLGLRLRGCEVAQTSRPPRGLLLPDAGTVARVFLALRPERRDPLALRVDGGIAVDRAVPSGSGPHDSRRELCASSPRTFPRPSFESAKKIFKSCQEVPTLVTFC